MRLPCMFWLKDNTKVEVDLTGDGNYLFLYTFIDESTERKVYEFKKEGEKLYFKDGNLRSHEKEALEIFGRYL